MSNKVMLYRCNQTKGWQMSEQGKYYSLEPYFSGTCDFQGYDDGGKEYILPDGFTVGEAVDGSIGIWDKDNKRCELIFYKNCPALQTQIVIPVILKMAKRAKV